MAVFARRPNGVPTQAVTIRIDPDIKKRVENYAKRIPMTANLAYEEILICGLSTVKESEAVHNAESETQPAETEHSEPESTRTTA